MAKPWSALTEVLASPLGGGDSSRRARGADGVAALRASAREAWLEAAGRLGLVRLGFESAAAPTAEERWTLAFPCPRAVVRWRAAAALEAGDMRADGEEIVSLEVPGGRLIAGAPRGHLPRRADLAEIGRLAAAIARREADVREIGRVRSRERRARTAAAAVHDLRNELTRALMWAHPGLDQPDGRPDSAGDAAQELRSALRGARALAGMALQGEPAAQALEVVGLRDVLTSEASAALTAARPLAHEGARTPSLRMRCGAERTALVEPRTFARAVRNLLTNAVEATARRGGQSAIEIEVRPLLPDDLGRWGELPAAGFDLVLEIRDGGVGFASDALRRYLEPSVELRALEAGASTGFGSSSVELALRASGLPIRVQSAPLQGTRVALFLRSRRPASVLLEPDVRRARRQAGGTARARRPAAVVATEEAARLLAPPPSGAAISVS